MIGYVFQGVGLGFAGAAQPGPFQAYIISQTLKNGWRRTLVAALAPLISDGPIIALVLLVLRQLPPSMQRAMHLASGLFLAYLARGAYAGWRRARGMTEPQEESGRQSLAKAVLMNFISPGPYIYWSLVAGPLFLDGWRSAPECGFAFLVGFYVTLVLTFAAVIVVFGTARQLGTRLTRTLLLLSAIALAGFGVHQLWLGVTL